MKIKPNFLFFIFTILALPAYAAESDTMRVTLLGTGSPVPSITRFSQSTLVEAGDLKFLIDAGRGASIRLNQAGVRLSDIDAVFITHFHHDHISGLADLLITSWVAAPFGGRQIPLEVYGPQGILEVTNGLKAAYRRDNEIRIADEKIPREGAEYDVTEYLSNGVVFDRNGVKVTAFEVNHGELIKPAYGYRVNFGGRSMLISGDTKYDERIISEANGVDVLIHEVAIATPELIRQYPLLVNVFEHHTYPEEAGKIFSAVKPKLAVYSHIILPSISGGAPVTVDDLITQTRTSYQGPLLVGDDLTVIDIADEVTFRKN